MKTTEYIANTIDRLPKGYIFTYADFITEVNKREAIIKALNRMVVSGKIAKLSKGKYYKPETTPFGNLEPPQYQIVKDLLEENGRIVGYLTGYSIYNQLGLTTQVGNVIQIGKNTIRPGFKRERYSISFIRQNNTITKENIPLLQMLDAIRYIKKIPDTTIEASVKRLISIVKGLNSNDKSTIARLALKYPPSVRATLGAILATVNFGNLDQLYKSLNPITKYKLGGLDNILPYAEKWNIV
ncbi:DUF6088 family protein [Carboxylicivirga marina]|uniref:AbiEi antitoxin C-terminal domain-containing protein n=1 Tax=Carboxylicivirga marina TaxID=2800988 RepID=A0ABS1HF03_9BACT|nr:DUF6088 family protein [Carboxylicivirga marina]MBK3516200.1 hypothetical protein [Carboxylicivirga marina]